MSHLAKTAILQGKAPEEKVNRPSRPQIIFWAVILLALLFISLFHYQYYQLGTHTDDSSYLILARSLITSPVYGMINAPGAALPAKYPFGYPLVLASVMLLFPHQTEALKIPSLIFTVLNMSLIFWGWKWFFPQRSYRWGLVITALYALAPMIIDHTRRLMSEPVFTFFCLVTILLVEMYVQGKRPWWWGTALSIALVFTIYTRSIGFLLLGAVFLYLLITIGRKFWKEVPGILVQMAALIGLVLVLTPVQWRDLLPVEYLQDENARFITAFIAQIDPHYTDPLITPSTTPQPVPPGTTTGKSSSLETLFFFGLKQHLGKDLRTVALPVGGGQREQEFANALGLPGLPLVLGYLVSAIIAVGAFRLLRQNASSFFMWFAVLYFAALFSWAWDDPRLLYPIQPQIELGFLAGLEAVILWTASLGANQKNRQKITDSILAGLAALLIITSAYKSAVIDESRLHAGDVASRSEWLVHHSSGSDIVMTEAPETDYVYSDRKTVPYPPSNASASEIAAYLSDLHIRYIIVAPQIFWQDTYHPVYSSGTSQLLKLLSGPELDRHVQLVYRSEQDVVRIYRVLS